MTTPRRFAIPVLTLLILGLGVFGYSEYTARIAAEQRASRLEQELARRPTTPAVAKSPEPVAPAAEPAPAPVEAVPEQAVPVPTATAQALPFPRGGPGGDWQALMESPEFQQLMSLRARGQLDGRYAALFAKLRLSPEQLQRLQQLLVDKQNTMRDVTSAMRDQGLSTRRDNADQVRSLVQNANAEIDNQIRSELGEAVYAQYQEYERTQPQRNFVDRVQQRLSYSGEALNEQQATSLVSVLAQASTAESSQPNRGPLGFRGGGGGNVTLTDATVAQASAFLSSSQVKALQELQREQQAQAELARRARENFNNRRNAATGTP